MAKKRRKAVPTAQRSMEYVRRFGWVPWKVEAWVPNPRTPAGGVRRDMLNMIDVMAWSWSHDFSIGIQSCRTQHVNEHLDKLAGVTIPKNSGGGSCLDLWFSSPHRKLVVLGWHQRGSGSRWIPTIVEVRGWHDRSAGRIVKKTHDSWPWPSDACAPPEPGCDYPVPF